MFRSLRKKIRNRWKNFQKARDKARKVCLKEEEVRSRLQQRRQDLKEMIANTSPLRLVVGASGVFEPGWIATDIQDLNLLNATDWSAILKPSSIDTILAEHVWEHLTPDDGLQAAKFCQRYLKPGGFLRLAIPDGLHPNPDYIEHVRIGGTGPGADDHKVLHTHVTLEAMLKQAGFRTQVLEYWDKNGAFHAVDWDPDTGKIHRSQRFDKRNADGQLRYTSLIVDAIKL